MKIVAALFFLSLVCSSHQGLLGLDSLLNLGGILDLTNVLNIGGLFGKLTGGLVTGLVDGIVGGLVQGLLGGVTKAATGLVGQLTGGVLGDLTAKNGFLSAIQLPIDLVQKLVGLTAPILGQVLASVLNLGIANNVINAAAGASIGATFGINGIGGITNAVPLVVSKVDELIIGGEQASADALKTILKEVLEVPQDAIKDVTSIVGVLVKVVTGVLDHLQLSKVLDATAAGGLKDFFGAKGSASVGLTGGLTGGLL